MTTIAYPSLDSPIAHQDKKTLLGNLYQQCSEECSCLSEDLGAALSTFGKKFYTPCGNTNLVSGPGTLPLKEELESHLPYTGKLAAIVKNTAMSA